MSSKNHHNLKTYLLTLAVTGGVILAGFLYIQFKAGNPDFNFKKSMAVFSMNIDFPKTYNQPLFMRMADFVISVLPLGARPAQAQTTGNVVKYIDAYQNTDVVQTKYSSKLKEDIILKKPGHPKIFEYQINVAQFDVAKDNTGNLYFFKKGHVNEAEYKLFTIPAPFMVDAKGKKSSTRDVVSMFYGADRLVLRPSEKWLAKAKYPVILDPTIEITILNVHSYPQQGENWTVDFTTQGTADLKIIPNDQATINDDEFVSLKCGSQNLQPQILAGDVIYYPNWSCAGTGQVVHYTKKSGNHTLKFDFGGQIAYAYNNYVFATGGTITYTDSDGLNPRQSPAYDNGYTVHTFTGAAFPDSETTPKTVTVNGNAQTSTAQSKFGGASGAFDGTGDYLSLADNADWDFGSGDFTVDFWVRFTSTANTPYILGQSNGAGSGQTDQAWHVAYNTELRFWYTPDGTTTNGVTKSFAWSPSNSVWYHVAVVRNGTDLKAFVDGTQVGTTQTISGAIYNSSRVLKVGTSYDVVTTYDFNGYLDEVRVSKGTARWTSNFTAPSSAYAADANTQLLIHADSSTVFNVTGFGSVDYLVVAGGGGGGAYYGGGGGAGGMITGTLTVIAQTYSVTVGSGATAVDPAAGVAGNNGNNSVFSSITATGGGGGGGNNGTIAGKTGGSGGGASAGSSAGSGTAGQGYAGGLGGASLTNGGGGGGAGAVGQAGGAGTQGGNGGNGLSSSISGTSTYYAGGGGGYNSTTGGNGGGGAIAVSGTANTGGGGGASNGVAVGAGGSGIVIVRYGSTGIPTPIIFRTAATDQYTRLLLHADGTGATFVDSESVPKTITANGDATQSATQSKFGGKSAALDGTGDYLSVGGSSQSEFGLGSSDFTIDTFVYLDEAMATDYRGIAGHGGGVADWTTDDGYQWAFYVDNAGYLTFSWNSAGSASSLTSTGAISINGAWHHIAAVRNSGTLTLYVDGTSVRSGAMGAVSWISAGTKVFEVGRVASSALSAWKGYIDEFRYSLGTARWTANFTPPTSAYSSPLTPVIFRAGGSSTFSASGGTITYTDSNGLNPRSAPAYPGGYKVHTFTSSGTFTVSGSGNVEVLVVAGGGGGGYGLDASYWGGGGGAGGYLEGTLTLTTQAYSVTVGTGGNGTSASQTNGSSGNNSVFASCTALGGGGGGGGAGQNGGSGGGAGSTTFGSATQGNCGGLTGYGNNGGSYYSGGGGGAGGAGSVNYVAGLGKSSSISGASVTYAAGGGGSSRASGGANTGTGGGGSVNGPASGNGGSGIVIIRYPVTLNPIIFK